MKKKKEKSQQEDWDSKRSVWNYIIWAPRAEREAKKEPENEIFVEWMFSGIKIDIKYIIRIKI